MGRYRYRPPDGLKLAEQAAEFLYELRAGNTGQGDAYLAWLLESPRHVEAFLRVSAVDATLSRLDPDHTLEVTRGGHEPEESNVTPFPPDASHRAEARVESGDGVGRWRAWLVAACLAVATLLGASWFMQQNEMRQWKHYVAGAEEHRIVELEDGSLLSVSPGSRVDVRFSAREREVVLQSGEALFRVHQEAARPFRVRSGGSVVQAIGTRFHVVREEQGSVVGVIDGRVRIDRAPAGVGSRVGKLIFTLWPASDVGRENSRESPEGRQAVFLVAGDEAYFAENGEVTPRNQADPSKLSSWRPKRLVFVSRTLGSMVEEFNLYSLFEIRVEGAVRERRYAAVTFDTDDPESFIAVLEQDPTLQVERKSTGVVIRAR